MVAIMTISAFPARAYVAPDVDPVESPFERACRLVGGPTKLARHCGVSPQALAKWRIQVPAERVMDIARATRANVQPQELRPDLYPRSLVFTEAMLEELVR